jgi:hypothetical protein
MPLSVHSTSIGHLTASILKCTLRTGGGRNRYAEILKDNNVLIEVKVPLKLGDTIVPWLSCPTEHISLLLQAMRKSGMYI